MKWEVVSSSCSAGSCVLGVVEADYEALAEQLANEKFHEPVYGIMYVRPAKASTAVIEAIDNEDVLPDLHYVFTGEVCPPHGQWNDINKTTLTIHIDRDSMFRIIQDVLMEGLGQEQDTFNIKLIGTLEAPGL